MNPNPSHVASDAIDDHIDHNIDRALSALRDAQPRSGPDGERFAARILASLEHRTAHRATNPGGLPFHAVKGWGIVCGSKRENARRAPTLALWAATSAAVLAVASLVILHHHGVSTLQTSNKPVILSGARSAQPKAGSPASVLCSMRCNDPEIADRATNPKPFSSTNPARTIRHIPHPGVAAGFSPRNNPPTSNEALAPADLDAQALADLHAPSHPAPPLPLTPEEKLLLRMLRYGNLTQLAELNPMVRARQDADETTAFKAFFPDPPPLQQSNGDTE